MKIRKSLIIRLITSAALIGLLLYMVRDSLPKMHNAVLSLPIEIFLLGVLLFSVSIVFTSIRLKILLSTQEIHLKLPYIVELSYMGYFFSCFLPTSAGGDIVKAFYISRAIGKKLLSYTTVFLDRFIGMSTIFFIGSISLLCTKEINISSLNWLLPIFFLTILFLGLLVFNKNLAKKTTSLIIPIIPKKIVDIFKNIYNALHNIKNFKLKIAYCLAYSALGQIICFSAAYFFAKGLGSPISMKLALAAISISSVISMLPSIYGVGPREMSIVFILGPFIGRDKALVIAFLWLGLLLTMSLIGGIIYAITGQYKVKISELDA